MQFSRTSFATDMRSFYTALLALSTAALSAHVNCDSVNTLYANNYINHGAMFDVVPTATITLDHINANINWGTATYSLYYRYGSFMGHETVSGDWTLLGTTSITSNNTQTISDLPTVIPIAINLPMALGDTIALYLTASPLSKVFLTSTATPWGTAYASDAYLSVSVARGVYQLFGTPSGISHIWNGSVSYCTNRGTGITSAAAEQQTTITRVGDELLVDLPGSQVARMHFVDMTGRTVMSTNAAPGRTNLPISGLTPGLYIVSLDTPVSTLLVQRIFVP